MNFFKTKNNENKQNNDKFLGVYIPRELFDLVMLISAFTGKTKSCIFREALNDFILKKFPDRKSLEENVARRVLRSWNLLKDSEKDNSQEYLVKNVRWELNKKGVSEKAIDKIIEIIVNDGKN